MEGIPSICLLLACLLLLVGVSSRRDAFLSFMLQALSVDVSSSLDYRYSAPGSRARIWQP